jgi:hypothetical protein
MTKKEAEELINEAKQYVGREVMHVVKLGDNNLKKYIKCKFQGWRMVSVSDEGEEPEMKVQAEIAALGSTQIYTVPLSRIMHEFRKADGKDE